MSRKEIYLYIATITICVFVLYLNLRGADLTIPLIYAGDGILNLTWIKSTLENGWYLHNTNLGAPNWQDMQDFPMSEGFNFLIIKFFGLFTDNASIVINFFYLFTYPLTIVTSLIFMRQMKFKVPVAMLGSVVFTFLPYHYLRGEAHLFLSGYYMIPLITLVALWVWEKEFDCKKWVSSILIIIVVGSSGIYYAFYTCAILILIGIVVSFNKKSIRPIFTPTILVSIVLIVGLINISPSIIYSIQNGANPEGVKRSYIESEIYGLKITNLILPVNNHRISLLASIKEKYNSIAPLNNENSSASLGLFGSLGFILLLFSFFFKHENKDLNRLSLLNLSTLVLTSIGGLGTVIAMFLTSEIRGYNRFSVFIAFYSIMALCIFLNKWKSKKAFLCLIVILIAAIFDQTSTNFNPQNDYMRSEFISDSKIVSTIQTIVPPSSMIFQLPYMKFPENGPINNMGDYDQAKPYIHSKGLKWSYGAMKGRNQDLWTRFVSEKPSEAMLKDISLAGFNGIYIDKSGYKDNGDKLIKELKDILKVEPIESTNGRQIFFNMLKYNNDIRGQYNQEEFNLKKNEVLHPVYTIWEEGFYDLEKNESHEWRWSAQQGRILINNSSLQTRDAEIEMILKTAYETKSNLEIDSDLFIDNIGVNSEGIYYKKAIKIPPGKHYIAFKSNAQNLEVKNDPRNLNFNITDFRLDIIN